MTATAEAFSLTNMIRALPALHWLRSYDKSWLRAAICWQHHFGGYLLPLVSEDASLANLPPQAGLYAAYSRAWFSGCSAVRAKLRSR